VFLSNGPGDPEPPLTRSNDSRDVGTRTGLRNLPGPSIVRARARRENLQTKIRPPWLEPSGEELADRAGGNHGAKSWILRGPDSLPSSDVEVTHLNLNDQTNEGLRHRSLPLFSVQYQPGGVSRTARFALLVPAVQRNDEALEINRHSSPRTGQGLAPTCKAHRHSKICISSWSDRDRAGLRVRLLQQACKALQGEALACRGEELAVNFQCFIVSLNCRNK